MGDASILRGFDQGEFTRLRQELDALPGTPIGRSGNDKFVVDGNRLLIKVAASDTTDEVYDIAVGHAPAPEMLIPVMHTFVRSFAALWKKAGERSLEPVGA